MAHLLFSQEQDQPIKWFEKFDKEEIKTEIKKWLTENPTDTLEHCKEYSKKDLKKYVGYEIVNLYENNKAGVASLVFIRGEKEAETFLYDYLLKRDFVDENGEPNRTYDGYQFLVITEDDEFLFNGGSYGYANKEMKEFFNWE